MRNISDIYSDYRTAATQAGYWGNQRRTFFKELRDVEFEELFTFYSNKEGNSFKISEEDFKNWTFKTKLMKSVHFCDFVDFVTKKSQEEKWNLYYLVPDLVIPIPDRFVWDPCMGEHGVYAVWINPV